MQVIVGDFFWSDGTNLSELRSAEKLISTHISTLDGSIAIAVNDLRNETMMAAFMGMATTFAICIVLATGSLLIQKVIQNLVLSPLENMMSKVREISENPIAASYKAEEEAVKKELAAEA